MGGLIALLLMAAGPTDAWAEDKLDGVSMPVAESPVSGPPSALVTIVEFSDFQCPFCQRVNPTLDKIREVYADDVRLVFKQNPLPFHKDAWPAAVASIAAQDQGKFWEMHDKLFANQKQLKRSDLDQYAMELGLNMAKFAKVMDSQAYDARIKGEQALAERYGARGTPAFFINGFKLVGALPFEKFKAVIDLEIAEARKLKISGVAQDLIYAKRTSANLEAPPLRPSAFGGPRGHASEERFKAVVGDSRTRGPADAPITLVESSDFQCPFCSRVGPTLKKIHEEYGDKVRFVFKHNPLSFHKRAQAAAEAAEAAGDQGKFWEMRDVLFANQRQLEDDDLERYATELGLNMTAFKAAVSKRTHRDKVKAQQALMVKLGARGTPSFFINGRLMSGARPFQQFKEVLDEELKAAEALKAKGIAAKDVYAELMKTALDAGKARAKPSARPARRELDPKAIYNVPLRGDEAAKGPKDALVTIVEYSDFQCPFCKRVGPTVDALQDKYGKDLRIVWKHNPLPFHKNAPHAAAAAEAAKAQGKFWGMHDLLFANDRQMEPEAVRTYAEQLGLDMPAFDHFLSNAAAASTIAEDQKLANELGARGTPAFFVNGRHLRGAQPPAAFQKIIDEELVRAKAALKAGATREDLYRTLIKGGATSPQYIGPSPAAGEGAGLKAPDKPVRHAFQIGPADPSRGPKDAKVTIVEWVDFDCPYCKRAQATLKQIEQAYPDEVRLVIKQLPLPFHKDALPAAKAALAAHEQGKFWEMHDMLMDNQRALNRDNLTGFATKLGLDVPRFTRALDGPRFDKWLAGDKAQAEAAGIRGTPNFLINGLSLKGAQPLAEFKRVIDAELASTK